MSSLSRVLFIAVDAGDKDLILKWSDEGVLPTFRSLRERAAWGPTANPTGLYVGAVWPSFWTGLSPARHGRYCFSQLRTGTYDHYHVTPLDTRGEPFWNALSEAGRRVAILDVPKTVPSERVNGIQIVDWGTHDPENGFRTRPESLALEIEARVGRYPIRQCDEYILRGPAALSSLRDALVRGVEMKARLAEHFLEQGGWDLFLTVFAESHCAGHQFWKLHDPSHPDYDPDVARSIGDPIRDVYVAIDAAVGRLSPTRRRRPSSSFSRATAWAPTTTARSCSTRSSGACSPKARCPAPGGRSRGPPNRPGGESRPLSRNSCALCEAASSERSPTR